ncbi:MAG: HPr kinase/phosphorylase [Longimicrobiales bacterium]
MTAPGLRARLYVLGVPVDFETNDQTVIRALADSLSAVGPAQPSEVPPPHVPAIRLWLADHDTGSASAVSFHTSAPHVLDIEGPGFHGRADAQAGRASCTLTGAALDDRDRFQDTILATLMLFLVTRLDRQPFHAAALQAHGRGVLLTGPSGAGKSTLAYAALRRGWNIRSDDTVYLQSKPNLRIWTRPTRLHLSPDAALWFDELAHQSPVPRDAGKWKLVVRVMQSDPSPPPLEQALTCFLERSTGAPTTRRLSVDDAIARSLRNMESGFSAFRASIEPVLHTLISQNGAWLVHTGSDPRLAVLALEQLLDSNAPT